MTEEIVIGGGAACTCCSCRRYNSDAGECVHLPVNIKVVDPMSPRLCNSFQRRRYEID